jgi:hypothetical protein
MKIIVKNKKDILIYIWFFLVISLLSEKFLLTISHYLAQWANSRCVSGWSLIHVDERLAIPGGNV